MDINIIDGKEYTNEEAHRLLWNWLADNPTKKKSCFFIEHSCVSVRNDCYACKDGYRNNEYGDMECTGDCPINWGKKKPYACEYNKYDDDFKEYEGDKETVYVKWGKEASIEKRSSLARQIANMEWNTVEKEKTQ